MAMHPLRLRKLLFMLFLLFALTIVTLLIAYALRQNISLFYTPTELVAGKPQANSTIRVGGMVVKGSIKRAPDGMTVSFNMTDYQETIKVSYRGILPDLFREGQGIVAMGKQVGKYSFVASEVLAKHDANYMPREVKAALAKNNGDKR